jgi:hypothetical protein
MVRRMEPLSYPCSSRNVMVRDASAGSIVRDELTVRDVPSRSERASGTRRVLSDVRAGRT